jgi:hypothetical protein
MIEKYTDKYGIKKIIAGTPRKYSLAKYDYENLRNQVKRYRRMGHKLSWQKNGNFVFVELVV